MQPGQSCFSGNSVPALGLHRVCEDFYVLIVFVFELSTKECKNRLRKLTYWLEILSEQWREHGFQMCKDSQLGVRIKGHQESRYPRTMTETRTSPLCSRCPPRGHVTPSADGGESCTCLASSPKLFRAKDSSLKVRELKSTAIRRVNSEARTPGTPTLPLNSWWPCAGNLTSVCLRFLICKMEKREYQQSFFQKVIERVQCS